MARFVLSTAGRPTALLLAGGALACLILGFGSVSLLPRPSLHANKHPPGAEHHAGAISESTQSEGFAAQVHAVDELHLARLKEGTSIWCQGDTVDSRRCRFANLCYNTAEDDFVAIHGRGSTWSGLPDNRFGPSLLSMSSVLNHNVQYMGFVDITGACHIHFADQRDDCSSDACCGGKRTLSTNTAPRLAFRPRRRGVGGVPPVRGEPPRTFVQAVQAR